MLNVPSIRYLLSDRRALVYLAWLLAITSGWVLTHYNMTMSANYYWLGHIAVGIGAMIWLMPLRQKQMQAIFGIWAGVITLGMIVSVVAFYVDALVPLIQYLGVFWMGILAIGYALNGLVDEPATWYYIGAGAHILGVVIALSSPENTFYQYLIAAVANTIAMGGLWLFRSGVR